MEKKELKTVPTLSQDSAESGKGNIDYRREFPPVLIQENSFTHTEPDYRPARTDVWMTTPTSLLYQLKTSVTENMMSKQSLYSPFDEDREAIADAQAPDSSFMIYYHRMLE